MNMLPENARDWINNLLMQKHPEGGYYSEVYRAPGCVAQAALPGHTGPRSFLTSIYFMLPPGAVSRFHRLLSDEIWYYHAGGSLTIHCIDGNGRYHAFLLGPDFSAGHNLQVVVPAGIWFGATLNGSEAILVGCAVAPGFDFADFEMADQNKLLLQFPQHEQVIRLLSSA